MNNHGHIHSLCIEPANKGGPCLKKHIPTGIRHDRATEHACRTQQPAPHGRTRARGCCIRYPLSRTRASLLSLSLSPPSHVDNKDKKRWEDVTTDESNSRFDPSADESQATGEQYIYLVPKPQQPPTSLQCVLRTRTAPCVCWPGVVPILAGTAAPRFRPT